jgi:hypothetical protein
MFRTAQIGHAVNPYLCHRRARVLVQVVRNAIVFVDIPYTYQCLVGMDLFVTWWAILDMLCLVLIQLGLHRGSILALASYSIYIHRGRVSWPIAEEHRKCIMAMTYRTYLSVFHLVSIR